MRTDDFDYDLPEELIAQAPAEPRDSCRLLVLHRETGAIEHRRFTDVAEYLEPGEYTYVKMQSEIETGTATDYALTLTGKTDNSKHTQRLPVETDLQLNVQDGWWTYNYMYATVTNDTDKPIYDITVVLALLDADGNILDIEDDSLYGDRALAPGSSIIIRKDIPSSFMDYYKEKGFVPTTVDAIAYVNVDVE